MSVLIILVDSSSKLGIRFFISLMYVLGSFLGTHSGKILTKSSLSANKTILSRTVGIEITLDFLSFPLDFKFSR